MSKDSYIRWQDRTIQQVGYTSHMFTAMAGGGLAYLGSILASMAPAKLAQGPSALIHLIALLLLAALVSGVFLNMNRVKDFRITARIARLREKGATDDELNPLRKESKSLGIKTWNWYRRQNYSFLAGAVFFVIFLLLNYRDVLY